MNKINVEMKEVKNKNGANIKILKLVSKTDKNLITYNDIENIFIKLKNEELADTTNMKIIGSNRFKVFTIKCAGQEVIMSGEDYFKNKANEEASKINGFYNVDFIY